MISAPHMLEGEFVLLKRDLIAAYEASGLKASGEWGESLEVQAIENTVSLLGYGYIQGRKSGTPPPSDAIEQWLKHKGIAATLERDISISSLAYLIARKMGREGWQPKEDIIDKVVTPERIQDIIDSVGEIYLEEFTTQILNFLKSAAA